MDDKRERVRKYGEVFTPGKTVNEMLDMLEEESPGCFGPRKTFLEPACGDGAFVVEILRRKFFRCKKRSDFTEALRSVYAMDIQERNVEHTIRNVTRLCDTWFVLTKAEREIIRSHVIQADALKVMAMLAELGKEDGA